RYVLAEGQMLEGGGDLVDLFHSRAQRRPADQHEHVARLDAIRSPALDRGDRVTLLREHASRTSFSVDAVRVDDRRIDRRALDDGAFGREIAPRKRDGARESA